MSYIYRLSKSSRKNKKYCITTPEGLKIHFGQKGASDFTQHKDPDRKYRYILRHQKRENWSKSGIRSSGWWSRWLLWEKPTLAQARRNIEQKFNIDIIV